jgi:glycosyltransferase involved in cell wall biosynthesis
MTGITSDASPAYSDLSDDPTVSVITPTYNHAEELPRAINSVLAQTFEDFEYIVVDDASTDDTESVVDSYDDERILYIRHEENMGGSAARNTGIEQARGRYIAFLDADDEWLPEKLAAQVECLEGRTDEWVAVHCKYQSKRSGRDRKLRKAISQILGALGEAPPEPNTRSGGEKLIREVLTKRLSVSGTTPMVRTDTVKEIDGFDSSFSRHQDLEFLIRVLKQGKLAFIDKPLAIKYESPNPNPDSLELTKMQYLGKFFADIERLESDGDSVLGPHWFNLSKLYFREGNLQKGSQYLLGADIQGAQQLLGMCYAITIGIYSCVSNLFSHTLICYRLFD